MCEIIREGIKWATERLKHTTVCLEWHRTTTTQKTLEFSFLWWLEETGKLRMLMKQSSSAIIVSAGPHCDLSYKSSVALRKGHLCKSNVSFCPPHFLSTCRSSGSETSPFTVVRQSFVFLCVLLVSKIISRTVYFRCLSGSRLIITICSTVNSLPIPTPPPKKCESAQFVNLRHITCHSCRVESTLVRLPAKNRLSCC